MTSCPEVGDDEKIILCGFGGRSMSVFEVIEGRSLRSPSGRLPSRIDLLRSIREGNMFPAKQEKV